MSIIGKHYIPTDNSYCINLQSGEPCLIVPSDGITSYHPSPKEEDGSKFEIISEPYDEVIDSWGTTKSMTFIKVKSVNTGMTYRCLYQSDKVVDPS